MNKRAGRVLSGANERKLRDAVGLLSDVLAQLGEEENALRSGGAVGLETRTAAIEGVEIRESASGRQMITGHAAVFNRLSVDLFGFREQIAPGAFADSLSGDIRALWQHDSARVLGRTKAGTLSLSEDNVGLAFEIDPPDTQDGRDALTLIGRGDVDQMSFGFRVLPEGDSWAEDQDGMIIRTLKRVSLIEVSPVTWAAYPDTNVSVLRSAPDWVQRALRSSGVELNADDKRRAQLDRKRKRAELIKKGLAK
jgi:uncharacterized protein